MATNFSANQYENSYDAKRLQNWQIPKKFKERPSNRDGSTRIISDDRGHLLSGVIKSKKSPWGEFKGTWDMDCRQTKHCHKLIHHSTQESTQNIEDKEIKSITTQREITPEINSDPDEELKERRHVTLDVPVTPTNRKIERQLTPHQSKDTILIE